MRRGLANHFASAGVSNWGDRREPLANGATRLAEVTRFISPLATRVARILNTLEEVPPHGAKVACFISPLATRAGPGRPGVARGRPGLFRGPAEAPFQRTRPGRPQTNEIMLFFNGANDLIS